MAHPQPQNGQPAGGSGQMFDRIAARYDRMNRLISMGLDRRWRRRLIEALGPLASGEIALDLATGTGDVAIAIARQHPDCLVVGIDPSEGMLAVGRHKVDERGLAKRVILQEGDAQALPQDDNSVAGVTMAFGIRNVPDRDLALREMVRVVQPGRKVAILELSQPEGRSPISAMARLHVHHVVPWLGAALSGAWEYRYLARSIAAFPSAEDFCGQMRAAGLKDVVAEDLSFGAVRLFVGTSQKTPTHVPSSDCGPGRKAGLTSSQVEAQP